MRILVFNCGSSSLKFELIEIQGQSGQRPENARRLVRGTFEEIGRRTSIKMSDESGHKLEQSEPIADHKAAAVRAIDWLGGTTIDAVAHRIVHGGEQVTEPALATDAIMSALGDASQFAPLHNPPAIAAIRAVGEKLSGIPTVIVTDIMLGTVDFAGTDGPLTKTQLLDFATHRNCDVLHFPMAIGADVPIYNIPGVNQEINFTPRALAGIYLGTITKWNDPEIAKPNPHISLPDKEIVVVHRQDGSGTTYVWTDYLSKLNTDGRQRVGTGISFVWPVGIAAKGNQGVVEAVERTWYSVSYAELTYEANNRLSFGKDKQSGRPVR